MKKLPNLVGVTGEHYIAAFLSGCGLIVALPRGGNPGTDLIVAEVKGGPSIRLQVKTGKQSKGSSRKEGVWYSWDTPYSAVENHDESLWYAYVWLHDWPSAADHPEIFFVPSDQVVRHMAKHHSKDSKRPFFWIYERDAERYRGDAGLASMRAFMKPDQ